MEIKSSKLRNLHHSHQMFPETSIPIIHRILIREDGETVTITKQ